MWPRQDSLTDEQTKSICRRNVSRTESTSYSPHIGLLTSRRHDKASQVVSEPVPLLWALLGGTLLLRLLQNLLDGSFVFALHRRTMLSRHAERL